MEGIFENFMNQNSFKNLFRGSRKSMDAADTKRVPQLSPLANSVVARCARVLQVPVEELQSVFESKIPEDLKKPANYARNLVEYCSFKAINVASRIPDFFGDKQFRRLTYDMMLAWEAPGVESESQHRETGHSSRTDLEDEDGASLFYSDSTNMAVQVDDKDTVGPEAFS